MKKRMLVFIIIVNALTSLLLSQHIPCKDKFKLDSLRVETDTLFSLVRDSIFIAWGELGYEKLVVDFCKVEYYDSTNTIFISGKITDVAGSSLKGASVIYGTIKYHENNNYLKQIDKFTVDDSGRFHINVVIQDDTYLVFSCLSYFVEYYAVGKLMKIKRSSMHK